MQYFPFCTSNAESCSFTPLIIFAVVVLTVYIIVNSYSSRKSHNPVPTKTSQVGEFVPGKCLNCGEDAPMPNLFCVLCDPNSTMLAQDGYDSIGSGSLLPYSFEQATIAGIEENKVYYTLPWAMFADSRRRLFILGSYPVSDHEHGTSHLRIKKVKGLIYVDKASIGDHRYNHGPASYFGVSEKEYLPVYLVDDIK